MEVWKHIDEALSYEVSNKGQVRNKDGLIMSLTNINGGYLKVIIISNEKIRITRKVHILVARAFVSVKRDDQNNVNHKDCNKRNNHYKNLEWVTHQENMDHAVENDLVIFGENHHLARHSEQEIREICKVLEQKDITVKMASFITGEDPSIIRDIINRVSWVRIRDQYIIPDTIKSGYKSEKETIIEICELLAESVNTKIISEKTGIDIKVILEIFKGERYREISKDFIFPKSIERSKVIRINEELVIKICKDINAKISNFEIALKYGISKDTVSKIKNGKTWVEVTKNYLSV